MIDLHSHILPAIDDGARSMEMALVMAQIAVGDGITHIACTPHITPGVFENTADGILQAISRLERELLRSGIGLRLVAGADVHAAPDLVSRLAAASVPTLGGSRYLLFEPPHHVVPPGLDRLALELLQSGYVPIITHPERLTWIENQYDLVCRMNDAGAAIQLTAASITGQFGKRAAYWSQRMLDEGRVDIIASDAHDHRRRPPILSPARDLIARRHGEAVAVRMTQSTPLAILRNEDLPRRKRRRGASAESGGARSFLDRLLGR